MEHPCMAASAVRLAHSHSHAASTHSSGRAQHATCFRGQVWGATGCGMPSPVYMYWAPHLYTKSFLGLWENTKSPPSLWPIGAASRAGELPKQWRPKERRGAQRFFNRGRRRLFAVVQCSTHATAHAYKNRKSSPGGGQRLYCAVVLPELGRKWENGYTFLCAMFLCCVSSVPDELRAMPLRNETKTCTLPP